MVEYHGWFSVHQSTDGESESEVPAIVASIDDVVRRMSSPNRILEFKAINGIYLVHLAGVTNHRSQDVEEVFELMHLISEKAKGSYGLLYLKDDEDKQGRDNEFVVYKLSRGEIEQTSDHLLSPCNPTITD